MSHELLPPDMALDILPQVREFLEPDAKADVLPSTVAQDADDRPPLHAVGQPHGAVDHGARGDPGEDPFLAREVFGGGEGAPAVDDDLPIQETGIQDGRDEPFLQAPQALDRISGVWLDGDDPDLGVVLLQTARTTHEGSPGPKARDQDIHLRAILQDLTGRRFVVRPRIGGIPVLVRHVVSRILGQLLGQLDGSIGAQIAVGVHDLGSEQLQELPALHGHIVGHHHLDLVAPEPCHHGQPDPGVAAGRLQDDLVLGKLTALLARLDHVLGDTVFQAAGGIVPLQLGEDTHARLRADPAQLHQWSVSDGVQEARGSHRDIPVLRAPEHTRSALQAERPERAAPLAGAGRRGQATEFVLVDEVRDRRMVAADRTGGGPTDLHHPELHPQRIEEQQAAHQRLAQSQEQLDRLDALNGGHHAAQHAEYARLRAAWHQAGGGRSRVQTAVAALSGNEHGDLALELEDAPVHQGLVQEDAGIVGQVAGGKIVATVDDDVVLRKDVLHVFRLQGLMVWDHLHVRVEVRDRFYGGLHLGSPDVVDMVQDLSLEVAQVHHVEVHHPQGADACRRQVEGRR